MQQLSKMMCSKQFFVLILVLLQGLASCLLIEESNLVSRASCSAGKEVINVL